MEATSPRDREARWMGGMSQRVAMLALTARNVSPEKENLAHTILTHFASRLDSLAFLLKEMQRDAEIRLADYGTLERGTKIQEEVEVLEVLFDSYAERGNLFLLCCCPDLMTIVQTSSKRLSDALDSVLPKASNANVKVRIAQVKEAFETGSPTLDTKQQAILDSLEPEILDSIVADPLRSSKIVQQIAESLELDVNSELFKKEAKKLKEDKESVENGKGKAYTHILEQVVSLLEKGISSNSRPANAIGADKAKPVSREVSMRSTPLTPLQSFICPITRDVMKDPVQIASGQTYEREAIDRWFKEGHTRCPMGVELKNTKMKSNIALRQSIAEWRELNYDIRIQIAREKLASDSAESQEVAVQELQRICEEDIMNKYTIANQGLLVPLIRLAEKQHFELRKQTFAALRALAEDNDENQDIMVSEGIIEIAVRCLARKDREAEPAILLLRLLSSRPTSAEKISHAHGAVLLLVMLLGSENEEVVTNVKAILENLPTSDENIVIMAEANLMKPLVARLIDRQGNTTSRVTMAKTLHQLQMPEKSKEETATEESIGMLLKMTQSYNEEERESALGALDNLSSVRHVCTLMTTAQPSGPEILMPLITAYKTTNSVKVAASRVTAHIMTSLATTWEPAAKKDEQVEWLVCAFLQLLNPYAPPAVHAQILLGLLGVATGQDSGPLARQIMKDREAFSLLLPFIKSGMDPEVKKNAVKLFARLSNTYGAEATAALKGPPSNISHIVDILREESKPDSEQVAAVTILANMPVDDAFVTSELLQTDCIPLVVKLLSNRHSKMQEAAAGALLRFTSAANKDLQLRLAAQGVIQSYVNLLDSVSGLTKERAARALANFSRNSPSLTRPVMPTSCFQCFSTPTNVCKVHGGECKIETSFCLKEADAVAPLLAVIKERQPASCQQAIAALSTLVDDVLESSEPGCDLIAKSKGIPIIINALNVGTKESQYITICLLEKVFRILHYRREYGAQAQMHVITVIQKGSSRSKQVAGKILRQLDLLHSQSHYFTASTSNSTQVE